MTKADQAQVCQQCGKLNPKILQGYHVTELCWCGAVKEGKNWVWRPLTNTLRNLSAKPGRKIVQPKAERSS